MLHTQVQFMGIRTVTAVQTQGNSPYADWVATFRLQYSLDCGTFQPVLDNSGIEKVITDLNAWCRNNRSQCECNIYKISSSLYILFLKSNACKIWDQHDRYSSECVMMDVNEYKGSFTVLQYQLEEKRHWRCYVYIFCP